MPSSYNQVNDGDYEPPDTKDSSEGLKTPVSKTHQDTNSVRRSSRANKGVPRPIFDPSDLDNAGNKSLTRKDIINNLLYDSDDEDFKHKSGLKASRNSSFTKGSKSIVREGKKTTGLSHPQNTTSSESFDAPETESYSDDDDLPLTNLQSSRGAEHSPARSRHIAPASHKPTLESPKLEASPHNRSPKKPKKKTSSQAGAGLLSPSSSADRDDFPTDKLSCICKKLGTDKLLVLCEKCNFWLHGSCVGLSVQRARNLEDKGEIYVCPNCSPTVQRKLSESEMPKPSEAQSKSNLSMKEYALKGTISAGERTSVDKKRVRLYRAMKKGEISSPSSSAVQKTEEKRKCAVATCNNAALSGSVYCSNNCILEHARLLSLRKSGSSGPAEKSKESGEIIRPKYSLSSSNSEAQQSRGGVRVKKKSENKEKEMMVKSKKMLKPYHGDFKARPDKPAYPRLKVAKRDRSSSGSSDNFGSPPAKSLKMKKQTKVKQSSSGTSAYDRSPGVYDFIKHHNMKKERAERLKASMGAYHSAAGQSTSKKILEKGAYMKPRPIPSKSRPSFEEQLQGTAAPQRQKPKLLKPKGPKEMVSSSSSKVVNKVEVHKKASHHQQPSHHKPTPFHRPLAADNTHYIKPLDDVRENVRNSLREILKTRSETTKELRMHPDSIQRLAIKIEESLFKAFGATNPKYKAKYRSITFNLKDEKNHGLWRKVIIGEVTSAELVQMTPDQMASKELAEWRQQNLDQELDIIQKQEKERASYRPIAKITRKGEIPIQEDLSDMIQTVSSSTHQGGAGGGAPGDVGNTRKDSESGCGDETGGKEEVYDTTHEHKKHILPSLHCSICTGDIKEKDLDNLDEDASSSAVVKSSTSIILSSEARRSSVEASSSYRHHDSSVAGDVSSSSLMQVEDEKSAPDEDKTDLDVASSPPDDHMPDSPDNGPDSPTNGPESPTTASGNAVKLDYGGGDEGDSTPLLDERDDEEDEMNEAGSSDKVVWCGTVHMPELASFTANLYPVCGDCSDLKRDLPVTIQLGGRINHSVAWTYLKDIKTTRSKQISIVRFHAANSIDSPAYASMMAYFSKRMRFGVLGNHDRTRIKDMYLIPLLQNLPIPRELCDLSDDEILSVLPHRPHSIIIGVVVRNKTKHDSYDAAPVVRSHSSSSTGGVETAYDSKLVSSLLERAQLTTSLPAHQGHVSARRERYSPTKSSKVVDDGYIPSSVSGEKKTNDDDDETPPPRDEEEYDPETAFATEIPSRDDREANDGDGDDQPYDPEEDDERLHNQSNTDLEELAKKQAILDEIKREISIRTATLQQLDQEAASSPSASVSDPRLKSSERPDENNAAVVPTRANPLQTILSALKLNPQAQSPPQLPDSTTKSDEPDPIENDAVVDATSHDEPPKQQEAAKQQQQQKQHEQPPQQQNQLQLSSTRNEKKYSSDNNNNSSSTEGSSSTATGGSGGKHHRHHRRHKSSSDSKRRRSRSRSPHHHRRRRSNADEHRSSSRRHDDRHHSRHHHRHGSSSSSSYSRGRY